MRSDEVPDGAGTADERVILDAATEAALRALLRIDAAVAARIRDSTGHRRRPRPQDGPTADYGSAPD